MREREREYYQNIKTIRSVLGWLNKITLKKEEVKYHVGWWVRTEIFTESFSCTEFMDYSRTHPTQLN